MTLPGSRAESPLPIDDALPALRDALAAASSVVLQAPPGAGKTTRVPLALLGERWLDGQRIVVLEPRRLAARAAARRMAAVLGEEVGGTIGFRVRGETRVGRSTRIEVVTEGVLTRLLHGDPALEGVGLVVFDEFHERSVHADLGLALSLQTQELLRPELRLLVMSATLDGDAVSNLLGGAPVVRSAGRAFPVDIRYAPAREGERVEAAVVRAVRQALARDEGGVLAFLPGAAEIARAAALLSDGALPPDVSVHPLFGDLPGAEQDAAVLPSPVGRRKVVLATSIAETSLTIEGVRVVVDSGLSRVSRFSPRSGMARLETVRVSRASAAQRCGRAGRTASGICYRLWSEGEQATLLERSRPEILMTDLAPLALDLALAGVRDPATLRWLDLPPAASLGHARALLHELGAIDASWVITPHGRAMAALGAHPRLAHMLLLGRELGAGATACAVAALLEDRDLFRRDAAPSDADLRLRLHVLGESTGERDVRVDRERFRRVRARSAAWRSALGVANRFPDEEAVGWLVALAYPDRIARRRDGADSRFLLRNGGGARLDAVGSLAAAQWLAVAETDGQRPESRVYLAAPLTLTDVERLFRSDIVQERVVEWQATTGSVVGRLRERLDALVLLESPVRDVDDEVVARALLDVIQRGQDIRLPWSDAALRLRQRVAFVRQFDESFPDWTDAALGRSMDEWLLPSLHGLRRRSEVESLDLYMVLSSRLTFAQRQALEYLAPTHVVVPTGSRIPVDYSTPDAPAIAVRLQEMFGLAESPCIADGRVTLVLQLLSPAGRPVQVTRDLGGFWRSSYRDVRKELRGRYPRHEWPEDPVAAKPTRRAKPRT